MSKQKQVAAAAAALLIAAIGCASGEAAQTSAGPALSGAPLAEGDPASGEALFSGAQPGANGEDLPCQACHSLDGEDGVGPSLKGVAQRVPEGYDSVQAYLYESITEPDSYVRDGFMSGIMPHFSKGQLDDQSLADLIAFLSTQ
jgi:cytochrome c oxidase subunit 2